MNLKNWLDDEPGRYTRLAGALGLTVGRISQMAASGDVPVRHCEAIEQFTDGAIRCEILRPDVNWAFVRSQKSTA